MANSNKIQINGIKEYQERRWYYSSLNYKVKNNSEYWKYIYQDKRTKKCYKLKNMYYDKRRRKWYKKKSPYLLLPTITTIPTIPTPTNFQIIKVEVINIEVREEKPLDIDLNTLRRGVIKEMVSDYRYRLYKKIANKVFNENINNDLINILNNRLSNVEDKFRVFIKNMEFKDKDHCEKYFDKLMNIVLNDVKEKLFNNKKVIQT